MPKFTGKPLSAPRRNLVITASSVVFLFLAIFPTNNVLIIEGDKGSNIIKVNGNETIELSFIHSVELSRWIQIYKIVNNKLFLVRSLTKSCGWGLPSVGEDFSFEEIDGETWMVFQPRRYIEYPYMIGTDAINDFTLTTDDKTIKLERYGSVVAIKVEKIGSLEYFLRRLWPEGFKAG